MESVVKGRREWRNRVQCVKSVINILGQCENNEKIKKQYLRECHICKI